MCMDDRNNKLKRPIDGTMKEMIDFFYYEFFPNLTKDQSNFIEEVINWNSDKKFAFISAKRFFEGD